MTRLTYELARTHNLKPWVRLIQLWLEYSLATPKERNKLNLHAINEGVDGQKHYATSIAANGHDLARFREEFPPLPGEPPIVYVIRSVPDQATARSVSGRAAARRLQTLRDALANQPVTIALVPTISLQHCQEWYDDHTIPAPVYGTPPAPPAEPTRHLRDSSMPPLVWADAPLTALPPATQEKPYWVLEGEMRKVHPRLEPSRLSKKQDNVVRAWLAHNLWADPVDRLGGDGVSFKRECLSTKGVQVARFRRSSVHPRPGNCPVVIDMLFYRKYEQRESYIVTVSTLQNGVRRLLSAANIHNCFVDTPDADEYPKHDYAQILGRLTAERAGLLSGRWQKRSAETGELETRPYALARIKAIEQQIALHALWATFQQDQK